MTGIIKSIFGEKHIFQPMQKNEIQAPIQLPVVRRDPELQKEDIQPNREKVTVENIKKLGERVFNWSLESLYDHNYYIQHTQKSIDLYRVHNELYCLAKDVDSQRVSISAMQRVFDSIEEDIEDYKNSSVIDLDRDDIPTFSRPYHKWTIDDKTDIYLLPFQYRLILEIFKKNEQTRYRIPLRGKCVKLNTQRCHKDTISNFDKHATFHLDYVDNRQRAAFLMNLKITAVEKTVYENEPYHVYLEPISYQSCVDRNRVSNFGWGVFLSTINGPCNNHVSIMIEGRNNEGHYFLHRAAYNSDKEVISEKLNVNYFKYIERTQVWIISSRIVREMLEAIEKDKNNPDRLRGFSPLGCDSIFSGGKDSCFTWAREKIEMLGINLGKSNLGFVCTRPKNFTHKPDYFKNKEIKIEI